ncbi:hypothetical protein LIER_04460 [Lithospermum erythrorhizon]|uniref:Uncharacterized protein n=1 Tax=Lithospermum erythrorhizon TaxID=34254 RepID=A0AAV3NX00_LITER
MTTFSKPNGGAFFTEESSLRRRKLGAILNTEPNNQEDDHESSPRTSCASVPSSPRFNNYNQGIMFPSTPPSNPTSSSTSPYPFSPWNQPSPLTKSPWIQQEPFGLDEYNDYLNNIPRYGHIGSLVREEGHVYSLAASGDLLYTGSESKNIRVWKNLKEYSGFKSHSGLVKAIVVLGDKIFTGHQDGKIRLWKLSDRKKKVYKRIGNLPTTRDYIKTSMNPKNYVEVRRNRIRPWIRHFDAVSSMSVDIQRGLLYSGSWDKTFKVWRLSDSKCLESVDAHEDAVNSIAVGFDGLVFTGSADGTVKVWRRELVGRISKHILVETLLEQANAVTSLVVNSAAAVVYTGSSDGLVNFWQRAKHFFSHNGVLRGHKLAVLCLALGGNLVLSGSADKSICVWRREEGGAHSCMSVLTGHVGPVKCLAMEEEDVNDESKGDQRWIVYSGSLDKSVKLWRVSENEPL